LQDSIDAAVETCRSMIEAKHHTFTLQRWAEPLSVDADPVRLA
jgi:hypothetical protein